MYKTVVYGVLGSLGLLGVYALVVSAVSGTQFATQQFVQYWYFIVGLAVGFGVQVGLYAFLKLRVGQGRHMGSVLGTTGAVSGVAMLSCCAHYVVNILPVLGAVGIVTLIAQYQVQLFWLGIAGNIFGILYMSKKVWGIVHI